MPAARTAAPEFPAAALAAPLPAAGGWVAPEAGADIASRKNDHLRIALHDQRVQQPGAGNGLGPLRFEMQSLPELDLDAVDLRCTLLGKTLRGPLLIGAMTGGSTEAGQVNRILAEAAERCQVGFCLGSQRPMLSLAPNQVASFALRDVAPTTLLLGNLGGIQLRDAAATGGGAGQVLGSLAQAVGADAMYVHVNPLQEAVQPEGDRDWRGVLDAIAKAAEAAPVPVLVKEVGAGLGPHTLRQLAALALAGVETAGVGGTSWSQMEALRHTERTPRQIAGQVLAGFGTPTAESVVHARRAFPDRVVIASGGLRDGLELAKCLALGATAGAMAWPFLRAAQHGVDAVVTEIEGVLETLRVTMFLAGASNVAALREVRMVDTRTGLPHPVAHLPGGFAPRPHGVP